ncbi:MAG: hypothetical protein ACXVMS_05700 [Flavisolibacter sp.]
MIAYRHKYQCLLQALEQVQKQCHDHVRAIEISFQTCYHYCAQLEKDLAVQKMDVRERVLVNKTVRAPFLAKLEYFILHYHAVLFCPHQRKAAIKFWVQEFLRMHKFEKDHRMYCRYFRNGGIDYDIFYYADISLEPGKITGTTLLARYLALEEYLPFVKQKLRYLGMPEKVLNRLVQIKKGK